MTPRAQSFLRHHLILGLHHTLSTKRSIHIQMISIAAMIPLVPSSISKLHRHWELSIEKNDTGGGFDWLVPLLGDACVCV